MRGDLRRMELAARIYPYQSAEKARQRRDPQFFTFKFFDREDYSAMGQYLSMHLSTHRKLDDISLCRHARIFVSSLFQNRNNSASVNAGETSTYGVRNENNSRCR